MNIKNLIVQSFILLMPLIDNLNGLSIKYFDISILGPLYRILFLFLFSILFMCDRLVLSKEKVKYIFVLLIFFLWYFIHYLCGFTPISLDSISNYLKFFYPILIYIILRNWSQHDKKIVEDEKKYSIYSISIYSIFIVFSFLIKFKYYNFKPGYYGFVYALNDLSIAYLLMLIVFLDGKNNKLMLFNLLAYILMASKIIFIVVPYFLFIYLINRKSNKKTNVKYFILVCLTLVISFNIFRYSSIYGEFFSEKSYLKNINICETYKSNPRWIYNELTYGRSEKVYTFFDNINNKTIKEIVMGSGMYSEYYTDYRSGMEMDLFDSFNTYGILGFMIYLYFYIFKMLKVLNKKEKSIFYIVILYSFFGGHLYNNPISGTYYAYLLCYFYERNFAKRKAVAFS